MAARRVSPLRVGYLRCEYLQRPIGIDAKRPRLSWELSCVDPLHRGAAQSAYQILVRKDGGAPARDTGRVASDRTAQIEYAGREPIRVTQEILPLSVKKIAAGTAIFDMGQNMVGWVRATVRGRAGERVVA
jgi:hypothetical protein